MNENYFNGKWNLIIESKCKDIEFKNSEILNMVDMERNKIFNIHHFDTDDELQKICFDIKKYEFDNDEVFSGHLIIRNIPTTQIDLRKLIKTKLDDNSIFVSNFQHTAYFNPYTLSVWTETDGDIVRELCNVSDDLVLCSSMVLWIISQRFSRKNPYEAEPRTRGLYEICRFHRIRLKEFKYE